MSRKKTINELDAQIKKLLEKKRIAVRNEKKRIAQEAKYRVLRRNEIVYDTMSGYFKNNGITDEEIIKLGTEGLIDRIFGTTKPPAGAK